MDGLLDDPIKSTRVIMEDPVKSETARRTLDKLNAEDGIFQDLLDNDFTDISPKEQSAENANEENEKETEFDDIWRCFLEFEEYVYDAEMDSFTGFLTEWQKRLTQALAAGLNYSETVLSLKLLKNSKLDKETRTNVFFALQSRPDYMQANLLLFTLSALNNIKKETDGSGAKCKVKTESLDDLKLPKLSKTNLYGSDDEDYCDYSRESDEEMSTESTNAYKCKECPMTCPRLQEFQRHEACHRGPARPFPCQKCTASFDKYGALERHLIVHTDSRIKCQLCDKEFFGDKALKYHMKNVHKKHLKCDHCPKLFERQSKLNKHMETHVKRQLAVESMFQCDQCGREIQGKKRLRIHKRTHFQFKCQPCNKIFKDQDLLNRHILNHREYPCDQCGQVYYQLALLQKHKNTITHGGERKFSCDQCGKTFMKKYNLQTHQLTHTGEKNFKCEFEDCSMAFYKKDVMIRHMRIHTGEKPYQCDVCERRFTQSGDMRKHRRTHGID